MDPGALHRRGNRDRGLAQSAANRAEDRSKVLQSVVILGPTGHQREPRDQAELEKSHISICRRGMRLDPPSSRGGRPANGPSRPRVRRW
ncbi:hypothetical protein DB31_4297 [Hyalangium minutum]|uniref:Uncharacterized protein n=1 Tax=Hyalangium minutum TaxID=394096 RepID=A0A085W3C8_9BACT|nr:hypothetical protein DB31_4297 [Hyalangium minutum]